MQRISDYELELMKIIWAGGGSALYADIARALEAQGTPWTKNTIVTLLSRLVGKGYLQTRETGPSPQPIHRPDPGSGVSGGADRKLSLQGLRGQRRGACCHPDSKDLLSAADYEALKKHWEDDQ